MKGEYPKYIDRFFKENDICIHFQEHDKDILKNGTVDFYTFSYYSTGCVTTDTTQDKIAGNLIFGVSNPYLEKRQWGWQIDPQGLRYFLNEIYDRYHIPIMVVENGLGQEDKREEDKSIHDYCIEYLREHILAMSESIEDGVDLIGYTPWGCIDLVAAKLPSDIVNEHFQHDHDMLEQILKFIPHQDNVDIQALSGAFRDLFMFMFSECCQDKESLRMLIHGLVLQFLKQ